MFEYFPNNYVWNLALNIALNSGARMGEIDEVSRELRVIAAEGADAGTDAFLQVQMPTLVTHGSNDRQIPLAYAQATYDDLVNSPDRELKVYTTTDGGIEHVNIDMQDNAGDFIADFVSERLTGPGR